MYVIRLPNGNLLVPESATAHGGQLVSDAYVEIGPADRDYERFAAGAMTQEEIDERASRWREGDARLHAGAAGRADGGLGPVDHQARPIPDRCRSSVRSPDIAGGRWLKPGAW